MSDRRRRQLRECAAEAPEAASAPTPSAPPSPLAAFLDDAESALCELREFESDRWKSGESR